MKIINLNQINLYDIGNEIQIAGVVWAGKSVSFVTELIGKDNNLENLMKMPLTLQEWTQVNRQADLLETEIFLQDPTGLTKIILRKSQRQLDTYLQSACWARDKYTCRYCGRVNTETHPVPLSVDHADLWEEGGIASLENLLTACKPCNKDRGRMQYEDWLASPIYQKKSQGLTQMQKQQNEDVLKLLPDIRSKRVRHVRSR